MASNMPLEPQKGATKVGGLLMSRIIGGMGVLLARTGRQRAPQVSSRANFFPSRLAGLYRDPRRVSIGRGNNRTL